MAFQRGLLGVASGLSAAAAFGVIPMFVLLLLAAGVSPQTTLVYRFSIAAPIMAIILLLSGKNPKISLSAFFKITGVSLLYMFEVLFYFHGLAYLAGGIAATLEFVSPVIVILIMVCFFHEQFRWQYAAAALIALAGVALLSLGSMHAAQDVDNTRTTTGVILILLSAFCHALYLVGIQIVKLPKIDSLVFNFYVLLTGSVFCIINALLAGEPLLIHGASATCIACVMALVCAVFSNLALILAIRAIGSTLMSLLGVAEPLTAMIVGCLVFHEPFTAVIAIGAFLVIASVTIALRTPGHTREV